MKNIGEWTAYVIEDGKRPSIHVSGIIPTNGEKPMFTLYKAEAQPIDPSELLLELHPYGPVDVNGSSRAFVHPYLEVLNSTDQHKTVRIMGADTLAVVSVEVKVLEPSRN